MFYGDARQPRAALEYTFLDAHNAAWDGDARQACAAFKGRIADARDAVRDGDARQPSAALEDTRADARDAFGDGDARQTSAALEGFLLNFLNTFRYDNLCYSRISPKATNYRNFPSINT